MPRLATDRRTGQGFSPPYASVPRQVSSTDAMEGSDAKEGSSLRLYTNQFPSKYKPLHDRLATRSPPSPAGEAVEHLRRDGRRVGAEEVLLGLHQIPRVPAAVKHESRGPHA
jgi:hypothetical protein